MFATLIFSKHSWNHLFLYNYFCWEPILLNYWNPPSHLLHNENILQLFLCFPIRNCMGKIHTESTTFVIRTLFLCLLSKIEKYPWRWKFWINFPLIFFFWVDRALRRWCGKSGWCQACFMVMRQQPLPATCSDQTFMTPSFWQSKPEL